MVLDWFDGGDAHIYSPGVLTQFHIGDRVTHRKSFFKKLRISPMTMQIIQEFSVATVIGAEHDSGSQYVPAVTYAILQDNKGQIFHRAESWLEKV